MNKNIKIIIILIILFCFVAVELLHISPIFQPLPNRDSGVFLYVSERILEGEIPYKDIWDHKAPLIYYFDALGLSVKGGSLWGVWLIEVISLYIASILSFFGMKKIWGSVSAWAGTIIWLQTLPFFLISGNFVEEYTLPFIFGIFWLLARMDFETKSKTYFWVGILSGIVFWIRPNGISIPLAIGILLLTNTLNPFKRKHAIKGILSFFVGVLSVFILISGYFLFADSLKEMVDQVFKFNFLYLDSGATFISRFLQYLENFLILPVLLTFVGSAWLTGVVFIFRNLEMNKAHRKILSLIIIALPLELFLSNLSGFGYRHYFITWVPIIGLVTGWFAFFVLQKSNFDKITFKGTAISLKIVIVFILFVSISPTNPSIFVNLSKIFSSLIERGQIPYFGYSDEEKNIIDYINSNTERSDYLLLWGNEVKYNFITSRLAPSKYAYAYMLENSKYVRQEMITEFIDALAKNKPLIIATGKTNQKVEPIVCNPCEDIYDEQISTFVSENYLKIDSIGGNNWPVYQYIGGN